MITEIIIAFFVHIFVLDMLKTSRSSFHPSDKIDKFLLGVMILLLFLMDLKLYETLMKGDELI